MKAALVAIVMALIGSAWPAVSACGGGQGEADEPTEPERAPERHQDYDRPVDGQGKQWGGWRWKGRHDTCGWVYKNECFTSAAAACHKAGCDVDACEQDDSAPVKVRCPK